MCVFFSLFLKLWRHEWTSILPALCILTTTAEFITVDSCDLNKPTTLIQNPVYKMDWKPVMLEQIRRANTCFHRNRGGGSVKY